MIKYTYLFLFLLSVMVLNVACNHKIKEYAAIKEVLEKESATWRSGDVKAHADCWAIKPYSKILISTMDGKMFEVAPQIIINPPAQMIGNGGTSVNTNYQMSIHRKNAWVCHEEASTSKDGTVNYSTEIRLLEKIHGQWKLVGQSIHSHTKR